MQDAAGLRAAMQDDDEHFHYAVPQGAKAGGYMKRVIQMMGIGVDVKQT